MRTNIVIDDSLMRQAMDLSGLPSKRATVEEALRRYVGFQRQKELQKLRGKIKWEGDLDAMRRDD